MPELTNEEIIDRKVSDIRKTFANIEKHRDSKTTAPSHHMFIFFTEHDARALGDFLDEHTSINVTYGEPVSIPRYDEPLHTLEFNIVTGDDSGYLFNQMIIQIALAMDIECLAFSPNHGPFRSTFVSDTRFYIPAFGLIADNGYAVMLYKQFRDCVEGDEEQRNIEIQENETFFTNKLVVSMRDILPKLIETR